MPINAEVAVINVNKEHTAWHFLKNFRLIENAATLLDVCPANVAGARGLCVLYRIQNKTTFMFIGFPDTFGP
jgi:hypothetical protein